MAVAYMDGSLFVVDMRGPRIILRREHGETKTRHSAGVRIGRNSELLDPITALSWTISPINDGRNGYL